MGSPAVQSYYPDVWARLTRRFVGSHFPVTKIAQASMRSPSTIAWCTSARRTTVAALRAREVRPAAIVQVWFNSLADRHRVERHLIRHLLYLPWNREGSAAVAKRK